MTAQQQDPYGWPPEAYDRFWTAIRGVAWGTRVRPASSAGLPGLLARRPELRGVGIAACLDEAARRA